MHSQTSLSVPASALLVEELDALLRCNMGRLQQCLEDTSACQARLLDLTSEARCVAQTRGGSTWPNNGDSVHPKAVLDTDPEPTFSVVDCSPFHTELAPSSNNSLLSELPPPTASWWTNLTAKGGPKKSRSWRYGAAAELATAKGWAQQISREDSSLSMDPPKERGKVVSLLEQLVQHSMFDKCCAIVIVANALIMAIQVEYMGFHNLTEPPLLLKVGSVTCTLYFLIELLVRMVVARASFFYTKEWRWNLFDLTIVGLSMVELALDLFGSGASSGISVFRVLRVLRIIRVIRIIRVARFFRELRIMINAIFQSARPMLWACVLLLMIMFICSVHLAQIVTDYRIEHEGRQLEEWERKLIKNYGTLHESIYTLFQVLSGGIDWGQSTDPLMQLHWAYSLFMSAFVAFTCLAVMNIVTGIFVETALHAPEDDQDAVLKEEWANEDSNMSKIMDALEGADIDGNGLLNSRELKKFLKSSGGKELIIQLGVDDLQVWGLFKLLDIGDTGSVELQEFIMGCLRLRGPAKSVDVTTLMYENKRVMKQMSTFMSYVEKQFSYLIPTRDPPSLQIAALQQTSSKSLLVATSAIGERVATPPAGFRSL